MLNFIPNSTYKPKSVEYLRIPLHEQSGSVIAYDGRFNGADFSGTLDLGAAPTWGITDPNAKCPSNNTTVGVYSTDSILKSVLAPPENGGLIVCCRLFFTTRTISETMRIVLQWGANSLTGGWQIGFFGGAISQFKASNWPTDASGIITSSYDQSEMAQGLSNRSVPVVAYIANGSVTLSVDGTWSNGGNGSGNAACLTDVQGCPANYGVSLLAGHASGGTLERFMNSQATDDCKVSDILVIRDVDGKLYGRMQQIANEYADNIREFPRSAI